MGSRNGEWNYVAYALGREAPDGLCTCRMDAAQNDLNVGHRFLDGDSVARTVGGFVDVAQEIFAGVKKKRSGRRMYPRS
jgi:hypothetical protein